MGQAAVAAASDPGTTGTARLVNIATRVAVGSVAGTPIPGFVLSGTGTKSMLVRAVGPTLAGFGVGGVLADPRLSLVSGATTVSTNDNWLAADAATMGAVGAFALTAGSKDAALVAPLAAGAYTTPAAADGGTGVALLEVYDASSSAAVTVVNAIAAHGYLHVFGGEGNDESPSGVFPDHDVYNPATNTGTRLAPMPVPVHDFMGAVFLNGVIHLPGGGTSLGGSSGSTIHQVFRPATTYRWCGPTLSSARPMAARSTLPIGARRGSSATA